MKQELKEEVYHHMVAHPTWSDYKIAEYMGVSRSMVWRIRKKLLTAIDFELAKKVAGKFLTEFQMASDYFKKQIEIYEEKKKELESWKDGTKVIFKKAEDGHMFPEEVDLGPLDKLAIERQIFDYEKQQTELWKDIIFLARQSEAVEVIKAIQDGRIKPNTLPVEQK